MTDDAPIQKNLYSCTAFYCTFRGEEIIHHRVTATADNSGVRDNRPGCTDPSVRSPL